MAREIKKEHWDWSYGECLKQAIEDSPELTRESFSEKEALTVKLKTAPAIAEKFRIRIKPKSPTSPFNQLANADSNSVFLLTLVA